MQSKTSCCNGAVLRRNLLRFCPLWAVFLAVWIVVLPLNILSGGSAAYKEIGSLQTYVLSAASVAGCFVNMFYAIFTVMALFSYLYSARSVNTLCALPIRRGTMFRTNLLTALTVWLAPSLLVTLLTALSASVIGLPGASLALEWLGITGLQYLFFLGLACLSAALVGQLLALPALYLLLNFTAIVVNYFARVILTAFVYGLPQDSADFVLGRGSPVYYICSHTGVVGTSITSEITHYSFDRWGYLGILAGIGVVLLVCAALLLRARRLETAGDIIAVRPLRPVFKYCFTAGCSLVLGVLAELIVFGSGPSAARIAVTALCLLAGGFIGYFGAEMLLKKTLHVFRREWIGYGVFALIVLCLVGALRIDLFGYERYIPDAKDVSSVEFSAYSQDCMPVTDEAHIADILALHQGAVSLKNEQLALQRNAGDGKTSASTFFFTYHMKDGKTVSRSYVISVTESQWRDPKSLARQFSAVYNDPELVVLRSTPTYEVSARQISWSSVTSYDASDTYSSLNLTSDEAWTLYTEDILPDIRDGKGGQADLFFNSGTADAYTASISIQFSRSEESDPKHTDDFYLNYTPIAGSRTEQWLLDHGAALTLQSDYDAAHADSTKS